MIEDTALLQRYCETKSEKAFAELVRRYIDLVYSVALRQVAFDKHLAEDVTQEVFSALSQKAKTLINCKSFSSWLYRSTQYASIQKTRSESRRRKRENETMNDQSLANDPEQEVDWDEVRPFLDKAICDLNPKDSDAVCLRFFENKSYSQIGETLNLSENAARMRVERALAKVNTSFSKQKIASIGAAISTAISTQASTQAPATLSTAITQTAMTATSNGVGLYKLIGLMNTTKSVTAIILLSISTAAGTAFFQSKKLKTLEHELAQEILLEKSLSSKIKELKSSPIHPHHDKITIPPKQQSNSNQLSSTSLERDPPTEKNVAIKLEEARALTKSGKYAEALDLYLWLYDIGMKEVNKYLFSRPSLLEEISEIGENLPAATQALKTRRANAEVAFWANEDPMDATLYTTANRLLGMTDQSLADFDSPDTTKSQKKSLRFALKQDFANSQRYQDAYSDQLPYLATLEFDSLIQQSTPSDELGQANEDQVRFRSRAFENASMHIEIMLGVGNIEGATELAARVLKEDNSPEIQSLLKTHLERVGRIDLLAMIDTKLEY